MRSTVDGAERETVSYTTKEMQWPLDSWREDELDYTPRPAVTESALRYGRAHAVLLNDHPIAYVGLVQPLRSHPQTSSSNLAALVCGRCNGDVQTQVAGFAFCQDLEDDAGRVCRGAYRELALGAVADGGSAPAVSHCPPVVLCDSVDLVRPPAKCCAGGGVATEGCEDTDVVMWDGNQSSGASCSSFGAS